MQTDRDCDNAVIDELSPAGTTDSMPYASHCHTMEKSSCYRNKQENSLFERFREIQNQENTKRIWHIDGESL
jgi:hypothetical protein